MSRIRDAWLVLTGRAIALRADLLTDHGTDFYEDDEPIEDIRAALASGEHGLTGPRITGTITAPRGLLVDDFPPGIELKEY